MNVNIDLASKYEENKGHARCIYLTGAIFSIIALSGILLDVIIGNITGGNLASLPQTAVDRFIQLHQNRIIGLYNLDLLNVFNQIMLIPVYYALAEAHRKNNSSFGMLALIIFLTGSIIMIANNMALSLMDLTEKYFSSSDETQKLLYAAAGESLLVKGTHGSGGMFLGFLIPNFGGLLMSLVMLKGRVFSKINSWCGILGNSLMVLYVILVTFVPGIDNMATAFAMPGGVLLIVWMILFTVKLFSLKA